ncbi:MAG TPA: vitamin K epoxide reductase family protein [Streptosporangiaceae bacterium]|nr:vitamin K epoxide reductase family protein [Streptosporangiaceae bacterium]
MAGQKPAGRRTGGTQQGPVRAGSPTARPATASTRQGSGKPKGQNRAGKGNPRNTPNNAGNGAAGGRSRTSGNGASAATAVRKPAARPNSAVSSRMAGSTPADQMAGRLLDVIGAPFRRIGRLPLIGRTLSPFRSMGALPLATFILALYGLGASIYLTIAHYDTSVRLACADKGLINCELVTTSPESILFGVFPVAVLGLAFYVFMVAINSPWGWRQSWPPVRWARLGSVIVGMCFVLYLVYAEIDEIHAICLWCTSVHVATFLIFALLVFHTTFTWGKSPEQTGANR